jgi:hypothetical protein
VIAASLYSQGSFPTIRETLRACLSCKVVDAVHLFCSFDVGRDGGSVSTEADLDPDIREMKVEFGGARLKIRGSAELALLGSEYDCTFVAGGRLLVPLAQRRLVTGDSASPICAILTGVDLPTQLHSYLGILASAAPQDALVTSCGAELAAVRKGLDHARALLASLIPDLRFDSDRVNVVQIPPGIDVNRFGFLDRAACRNLLGLAVDATIILNLGRFSESCSADLEPLLFGFRLLLDENPDLLLVLANTDSEGKHSREAAEYCQWLGLESHTKIIPQFQASLRALLYAAADVVVSLRDNIVSPFDTYVLEAMASGIPVVATDWCGNQEIVLHGQTGFLVPTLWNEPAAAILSWLVPGLDEIGAGNYLARRTVVDVRSLIHCLKMLTDSKDLREEFGAAARTRVLESFTWNHISKLFENLWEEQMRKRRTLQEDSTLRMPLSFDDMFRQYASNKIAFEMEVISSERASALVALPGGAEFPIHIGNVVGEFRNEILRILDYCMFPRTIRSIVESGNEFAYEAVVWLLKKGFCELKYA